MMIHDGSFMRSFGIIWLWNRSESFQGVQLSISRTCRNLRSAKAYPGTVHSAVEHLDSATWRRPSEGSSRFYGKDMLRSVNQLIILLCNWKMFLYLRLHEFDVLQLVLLVLFIFPRVFLVATSHASGECWRRRISHVQALRN